MDYKDYYDKYKKWHSSDYKTGTVNGSDIFDTSQASGYDYLIPGNSNAERLKRDENLEGHIVMMTPLNYLASCADMFTIRGDQTTLKKQLAFIRDHEQYKIDYLKSVITDQKKKFPMTYIDYANETQEGRHRMYAAGELFGWNTKFPVLVVGWADPERAKREKQEKHDRRMYEYLEEAIEDIYKIKFVSWEDVVDELEYDLETLKFNLEDRHSIPNVVYDIEKKGNSVVVSLMDKYKITIEEDDIQWISQEEKDRLDKEFDDEINRAVDDLDNLPDDILADDIIGHFLK